MIVRIPVAVLSEHIKSRPMIIGHQRCVQRSIIIERRAAADRSKSMCQLPRIAQWLLGDDINGSGNSGRTEQGRTSASHHLYPLDHIGRNLFQPVNTGKGTEDGTRIDKNLCIRTVQSIDAHLLETAILTVRFDPDTGLEVKPLRKCRRVCILKHLHIYHIDQCRCQAPFGHAAIGRNYHSVKRYGIFFQLKIFFKCLSFPETDIATNGFIPHRTGFEHKIPFGKVFQEIVSGGIRHRTNGSSFQGDCYIREVFTRFFIEYMTDNIGIRRFQFQQLRLVGHSRQQGTAQANEEKYIFLHFHFWIVELLNKFL